MVTNRIGFINQIGLVKVSSCFNVLIFEGLYSNFIEFSLRRKFKKIGTRFLSFVWYSLISRNRFTLALTMDKTGVNEFP